MPKPFKWIEPKEKEIENAILDYLKMQKGVFAFKINTVGVYDQRGGFFRKLSKHVIAGTPDIIACVNGRFLALEVKSSTGRQSQVQKDFENNLKHKSNGLYFVVRSMKDVELVLLGL